MLHTMLITLLYVMNVMLGLGLLKIETFVSDVQHCFSLNRILVWNAQPLSRLVSMSSLVIDVIQGMR